MGLYEKTISREISISEKILYAKSVLLEMEMEARIYASKNGENEKYKQSIARIESIWEAIDHASEADSSAYVNRLRYEKALSKNISLMEKVASLEHQIEASARAFEGL